MNPPGRNRGGVFARAWPVATLALMPFAVPALAARGQSLTLTTRLSSYYDSNILQYSPDQITLFDGGTRPTHFSIKTRDDLVWNPSVALAWELDEGHGRRHALRLKGEGDFHDKNGTADFRSLSAGWRESFHGERRLSVGYYVLPEYYLRQLLDEDQPVGPLTRYHRATFKLQIATAGWDQRLTRNTTLGLDYQYEGRTYNPRYRERTSKLHQGSAVLGWDRLPHRASVDLRGGYRVSNADASDGDEAPGAPPDDQDVSYHGLVADLGGRMEFARSDAWRLVGDLGYELETRAFESDRTFDTSHHGRKDVLNAVEFGMRALYRPHWSVRGFYRYEHNHASFGAATAPTTDPGSYNVHQVGVAVEWSGEIWTRARSVAPAAGAGDN